MLTFGKFTAAALTQGACYIVNIFLILFIARLLIDAFNGKFLDDERFNTFGAVVLSLALIRTFGKAAQWFNSFQIDL